MRSGLASAIETHCELPIGVELAIEISTEDKLEVVGDSSCWSKSTKKSIHEMSVSVCILDSRFGLWSRLRVFLSAILSAARTRSDTEIRSAFDAASHR
jgi:hypothetical protein